ncbi:MAG TPA: discoidin domain-containing protein, partial [Thermomicrobiales bacterium]|nr:discoidin domain-containing protein [Thermomicrobiales bacterium]
EITTLAEGDAVAIIGEIVGAGEDRWVPVICGDSQAGFIAARFVGSATELPPALDETVVPDATDAVEGASVATEGAVEELASTEEGILTDEPVVTEEPVATEAAIVGPYPVVDTADSEGTGTGVLAVDADPATVWSVTPSTSPDETWLLLDLGQVVPVARVTWELGSGGSLPPFEFWLSDDGSTWWNAAQINGWNLQSGVEYEAPLNLWTRYVMIVVPDVEATGLGMVGGIGEIRIWPANEAQALGALGSPVTPEPDLEPTEEPVEESRTEEPPVLETTEAPPEEPAPDESESGIPPEGPEEETPPAQG